jgi:hypothetical protein
MAPIDLTEEQRREAELVTLTCDPCRDHAGRPPLPGRAAARTWYYCPCCQEQWTVKGTNGPLYLFDFTVIMLWFVVALGALVGIIYLVTADAATRFGAGYFNDGRYIANLGVGMLCWGVLAMIWIDVYTRVLTSLTRAARFVWGH